MNTRRARTSILALLSVSMAVVGCAVGIGPLSYALGDGAAVERDADGKVREVRGAALSEVFGRLAEATVGRAVDGALWLIGRSPVPEAGRPVATVASDDVPQMECSTEP